MKGSKNVSEIVKLVNKSQPNISIALGKLSDVGLISYKREKKKIVYSIKNKEFVEKILNLIKNG
jgi:DNA-binding transcriptional ArsR family regulator